MSHLLVFLCFFVLTPLFPQEFQGNDHLTVDADGAPVHRQQAFLHSLGSVGSEGGDALANKVSAFTVMLDNHIAEVHTAEHTAFHCALRIQEIINECHQILLDNRPPRSKQSHRRTAQKLVIEALGSAVTPDEAASLKILKKWIKVMGHVARTKANRSFWAGVGKISHARMQLINSLHKDLEAAAKQESGHTTLDEEKWLTGWGRGQRNSFEEEDEDNGGWSALLRKWWDVELVGSKKDACDAFLTTKGIDTQAIPRDDSSVISHGKSPGTKSPAKGAPPKTAKPKRAKTKSAKTKSAEQDDEQEEKEEEEEEEAGDVHLPDIKLGITLNEPQDKTSPVFLTKPVQLAMDRAGHCSVKMTAASLQSVLHSLSPECLSPPAWNSTVCLLPCSLQSDKSAQQEGCLSVFGEGCSESLAAMGFQFSDWCETIHVQRGNATKLSFQPVAGHEMRFLDESMLKSRKMFAIDDSKVVARKGDKQPQHNAVGALLQANSAIGWFPYYLDEDDNNFWARSIHVAFMAGAFVTRGVEFTPCNLDLHVLPMGTFTVVVFPNRPEFFALCWKWAQQANGWTDMKFDTLEHRAWAGRIVLLSNLIVIPDLIEMKTNKLDYSEMQMTASEMKSFSGAQPMMILQTSGAPQCFISHSSSPVEWAARGSVSCLMDNLRAMEFVNTDAVGIQVNLPTCSRHRPRDTVRLGNIGCSSHRLLSLCLLCLFVFVISLSLPRRSNSRRTSV